MGARVLLMRGWRDEDGSHCQLTLKIPHFFHSTVVQVCRFPKAGAVSGPLQDGSIPLGLKADEYIKSCPSDKLLTCPRSYLLLEK